MKNLLIPGIIVLVFIFFLVPSIGSSLLSMLVSDPRPCEETPYASNCLCPEGEMRVSLDQARQARLRNLDIPETEWVHLSQEGMFFCESAELIIDPDQPSFNADILNYCQQRIRDEIPACETRDLSCSGVNNRLDIQWFLDGSTNNRHAFVECRENTSPTSHRVTFRCHVNLEDGSILSGVERFLSCVA